MTRRTVVYDRLKVMKSLKMHIFSQHELLTEVPSCLIYTPFFLLRDRTCLLVDYCFSSLDSGIVTDNNFVSKLDSN